MSKKVVKGEDGKEYVVKENKKWYKRVWVWIVIIAVISVIGIIVGMMNSDSNSLSGNDNQNTSSSVEDISDSEDTNDTSDSGSDGDSITVGESDINIADKKDYSPELTDDSWSGSDVYISKVAVYKTDGTYEDEDKKAFEGVIAIDTSITANRDISAYPTQGTINTSDGQQIDADLNDSDDFDGDINNGATVDGTVYFLVPNLESIKDIKSIRLKFDSSYDTDDFDDNNDFKTYDINIPLAN